MDKLLLLLLFNNDFLILSHYDSKNDKTIIQHFL